MKSLIILIFLIITGEVFSQEAGLEASVVNSKKIKGISAASGLEKTGKNYYIVEDNNAWLYVLNPNFKIKSKSLIFPAGEKFETIPKSLKPDFESVTNYSDGSDNYLLIFGSGSLSPQRDFVVRFKTGEKTVADLFSINEFYEKLRETADIKKNKLNIEGSAMTGGMLYLFDRGSNKILVYNWKEVERYFREFKFCPVPLVYKVNLPELEGVKAGFSGAVAAFNGNKIIFTASVEDTDNPVDDGEILGSYVGIIDLLSLKDDITPICVPVKNKGEIMKTKVEGVLVKKETSGNAAELLLVIDNDNSGSSNILEVEMKILFK